MSLKPENVGDYAAELYGFKPGTFTPPIHGYLPDHHPAPQDDHIWITRSLEYLDDLTVYFFFDGNWIRMSKEKLLDPNNLRLRREWNEKYAIFKEIYKA